MGLMVDTGVFIRMERQGNPHALSRFAPSEAMLVSAITVSELLLGAYLADGAPRQAARFANIEAALQRVAILEFNDATARIHARLHADLRRRGQLIGAHDLIIAATALEHGHAVLTTNRREFDRIPGLQVLDFPAAA